MFRNQPHPSPGQLVAPVMGGWQAKRARIDVVALVLASLQAAWAVRVLLVVASQYRQKPHFCKKSLFINDLLAPIGCVWCVALSVKDQALARPPNSAFFEGKNRLDGQSLGSRTLLGQIWDISGTDMGQK